MLIEMDKSRKGNIAVNGRNNRALFFLFLSLLIHCRFIFVLVKILSMRLDVHLLTLCVTNVLLREKAREQISHLYFFKFFDLVLLVGGCVLAFSPLDVVGRRMKSIRVADEGTNTLLFVIVY